MDFQAIHQLRLKEAFKGVKVFDVISSDEKYLARLFECDSKAQLFVYDDEQKGYCTYVTDTNGVGHDKCLDVINKKRKDVFLWRIDGVLYRKNEKCDCAVLTNKEIYFVEFKSKVSGRTEVGITGAYEKAYSQLLTTLNEMWERFEAIDLDLSSILKVRAIVVLNQTIPQNSASQKHLRAKFIRNRKKVPLLFTNKINILDDM